MVALFCMGFNMKIVLRNYFIVLAVVYLGVVLPFLKELYEIMNFQVFIILIITGLVIASIGYVLSYFMLFFYYKDWQVVNRHVIFQCVISLLLYGVYFYYMALLMSV